MAYRKPGGRVRLSRIRPASSRRENEGDKTEREREKGCSTRWETAYVAYGITLLFPLLTFTSYRLLFHDLPLVLYPALCLLSYVILGASSAFTHPPSAHPLCAVRISGSRPVRSGRSHSQSNKRNGNCIASALSRHIEHAISAAPF